MPRWRAKRCRHLKASRCEGPSVNGHLAEKMVAESCAFITAVAASHKLKWLFTYLSHANLDYGAE